MSRSRVSLLVLSLALIAPATAGAQAQQPRQFENAWFWGAKGGAMLYSTREVENAMAPSGGIEWVITRSRAALYASYERAFFTEETTVSSPFSVTGTHPVELQDLQRVSFGAIVYPTQWGPVRPYAGLALAIHLIGSATPGGTYVNGSDQLAVEMEVEELRSQASPLALVGLQGSSPRWTLFAQLSAAPVKGFFLSRKGLYGIEAGLRYNIGSSIERVR